MTIKATVKSALMAFGIEIRRTPRSPEQVVKASLKAYFRNGQRAWSQGYSAARQVTVVKTLTDTQLMSVFRSGDKLPNGYGVGIDERCVEYPWVIAHLPPQSWRMLDAGSTFNRSYLLDLPEMRARRLHIVTLAPEEACYHYKNVSYMFEDIRSLPMKDGLYDVIVCISTLEHIGMDNAQIAKASKYQENSPDDFVVAVKELSRVLTSGGTLLMTIPFGRYQRYRYFQQFDMARVRRAIDAFGAARSVKEQYYRYTRQGWNTASGSNCEDCRYVDWVGKVMGCGELPRLLPEEEDRAAASRAVACVALVKA